MSFDLLKRTLHHLFDEKLAVAQLADRPFGCFLVLICTSLLHYEFSCLGQTLLAIGVAAKVTMTALKIAGFLPLLLTGTAFSCIMVATLVDGPFHEENLSVLVEVVLAIFDHELA